MPPNIATTKKKPANLTRDGFPMPFEDGVVRDSYECLCVLCLEPFARVRSIRKGQGAGGYAVSCPQCASTIFLCRPDSVTRWRAMQQLFRDQGARDAMRGTLTELGRTLTAGELEPTG